MSTAPLAALTTYAGMRATPWRFRDRAALLAWQERQVARLVHGHLSRFEAFADRIVPDTCLTDLPVMDKTRLMSDFSAYNLPRLSADTVRAAIARDRRVGPWHVGHSTGTSGNRGLYVLSDRDRYRWLGGILAKALPDFWRRRTRLAVVLPTHTRLYDAAHRFGPLSLCFHDLTEGPDAWMPRLAAQEPTLVVAPPRVLVQVSERLAGRIAPARFMSGGEVLDPVDARMIQGAFPGARLGQIYMATEGLIAVTCREGRLHLCEDAMHVELEPAAGGLVRPVLTDFRREAQAMVRYRMNDLLRMDPDTCPCGNPCRVVAEVVGREDDVIRLPGGGEVTPDILRNAVLDASPKIADFRVVQEGCTITVTLEPEVGPDILASACAGVDALLARHGGGLRVVGQLSEMPFEPGRKLRRVERCSAP